MGADLAASGDGEAAQEKFKDGQELAVRTIQRGPEVAQSYTLAVLLTKVGEALPLKHIIAELVKVRSWAKKAAVRDEPDARV